LREKWGEVYLTGSIWQRRSSTTGTKPMLMDEFTSTRNGTVLIENNKFKCSAINLWYSHIWNDAMPTKEDK
jgi:hypothetical protein